MEHVRKPPGADAAALAEVEHAYALALPVELRQFWSDSDGPILWFGYKELQFFRVVEILDDICSVKQYMPGALPLCMDGNGNICVAKVVAGSLEGYYVAACGDLGWKSARFIAKTFDGLIDDDLSPETRLNA